MLTNDQKSLLKRAQRQAGLNDADYRYWLGVIAQVESSTDARIGDRHLDRLLAQFEAVFWQRVDAGACARPRLGDTWAPFRERGYWARKNTAAETSRDRFVKADVGGEIIALENEMYGLGFNTAYVAAIRLKVTGGHGTPRALQSYKLALARTVASKVRAHSHEKAGAKDEHRTSNTQHRTSNTEVREVDCPF